MPNPRSELLRVRRATSADQDVAAAPESLRLASANLDTGIAGRANVLATYAAEARLTALLTKGARRGPRSFASSSTSLQLKQNPLCLML